MSRRKLHLDASAKRRFSRSRRISSNESRSRRIIPPQRFSADPALCLKPFVREYWGIVRDLSEIGGFSVTPDRFPELLFFAEPPFARDATGRRQLPACVFIGLLRAPLHLEFRGPVRCASIRLYAWSAGMFLGRAYRDPDGQWFAAPRMFWRWLPRVQEALKRCRWAEVPPLFDAALSEAFSSPPSLSKIEAVRAFAERGGGASIATQQAAQRLNYSRRQVERQVREVTGISPKQLASLARFQFVRDAIWAKPDWQLASLAFDAGYADQAHMNREFRRYTGQTPLEFRRACARLKGMLKA